jgi:hypothetical protein
MTLREPYYIRCRCVACSTVTVQPSYEESDIGRYTKSWFCGCARPPKGNALDAVDGEIGSGSKK